MDAQRGIEERLREAFSPVFLEIVDDSRKHVGHPGASGGGHFSCVIVSGSFRGRSPLERHRAVYEALGDLRSRGVHALSLETWDPEEWRRGRRVLP
jgi:BolA protein